MLVGFWGAVEKKHPLPSLLQKTATKRNRKATLRSLSGVFFLNVTAKVIQSQKRSGGVHYWKDLWHHFVGNHWLFPSGRDFLSIKSSKLENPSLFNTHPDWRIFHDKWFLTTLATENQPSSMGSRCDRFITNQPMLEVPNAHLAGNTWLIGEAMKCFQILDVKGKFTENSFANDANRIFLTSHLFINEMIWGWLWLPCFKGLGPGSMVVARQRVKPLLSPVKFPSNIATTWPNGYPVIG